MLKKVKLLILLQYDTFKGSIYLRGTYTPGVNLLHFVVRLTAAMRLLQTIKMQVILRQ
jgi:hypothetical protein